MGQSATDRTQTFVALLLKAEPQIYAYVRAQVFNRSDADDVFQETAAVLWEKFDDFTPGTNFTAWGYQIARNKILQHFRSQHRRGQSLSEAVIELLAAKSVALGTQLDDRRAALTECLKKLPVADRDVLERSYEPGVTIRDVAETVGRPYDTVKSILKRSRQALHACVQRTLAAEERV